MSTDKDHIKDIFRSGLYDYESDISESLWEKIVSRINRKKKRALWYWAAAASLTGIIIAVILLFNNPEPVQRQAAEKQITTKEVPAPPNEFKKDNVENPEMPDNKNENSTGSNILKPEIPEKPVLVQQHENAVPTNNLNKDVPVNKIPEIKSEIPSILATVQNPEQITGIVQDNENPKLSSAQENNPSVPSAESRVLPESLPIQLPFLSSSVTPQSLMPVPSAIPAETGFVPSIPNQKLLWSLDAAGGTFITDAEPLNEINLIPGPDLITIIQKIDTTGYNTSTQITWTETTQKTSIGYIPVSIASVQTDTTWVTQSSTETLRTPTTITETAGKIEYSPPVIAGVSFTVTLSKKLEAAAGLSYGMYKAKQDFLYSDGKSKHLENSLNYIIIPVEILFFPLSCKNVRVYLFAGPSFEFNLSDKSTITASDPASSTGITTVKNPAGGYGINIREGGGVEYRFSKNTRLYLQGGYSSFIKKDNHPYNPSKYRKGIPSVQTGIRINF
ncbi:MAG: PorT family protein [Bacteroidetes bacterium]|nr:PorT family protein [Bacteroidota bacterium]